MGYINIFVSSEANLSIKANQLVLKNSTDEIDYPIEDVNSIMVENQYSNLSTFTLSKIAQHGILLYVCDSSHLPCGVMLPFCQHYQTLSCFNFQNDCSKPLKKQLWQTLIKNKIANQNDVLNMCGGGDELKPFINKVLSGDSSNIEATASLIYFKNLFGKDFKRRDDGTAVNDFLNYGYAIIRGFVARSIVVHGLTPFLGINHKNQFNQFNLADDLMEVFRPIVDLFVKVELSDEPKLSRDAKRKLFGIINIEVLVGNQRQSLSYAIDLLVQSFVKSLKEQKIELKPITILGLNIHSYE